MDVKSSAVGGTASGAIIGLMVGGPAAAAIGGAVGFVVGSAVALIARDKKEEKVKEKVNILVTLPFAPERFHVIVFQRYGRVSGTQDNSIEVRGVKKADLHAVARPYWVTRVEPLPTGG